MAQAAGESGAPAAQGSPDTLFMLSQRNELGKLSDETLDRVLNVDTEYERRAVLREMKRNEEDMTNADRDRNRSAIAGQMLEEASPDMQAVQQLQMANESALAAGAPPGAGGASPPPMSAPAPQPGMPQQPAGAPQSGINAAEQPALDAVSAKAQQTATDMMSMYRNPSERGAVLRTMEAQNPQYAALVKMSLEDQENEARKMGLDQARGAGAPPM